MTLCNAVEIANQNAELNEDVRQLIDVVQHERVLVIVSV